MKGAHGYDQLSCRHATAKDAGSIASIHVASWRDAYSSILDPSFLSGEIEEDRQSEWIRRLNQPSDNQIAGIASFADSEAVGFICAYRDKDPDWGSLIDNLHVLRSFQGRGVGRFLMQWIAGELAVSGEMRRAYLWVFEENDQARNFYKSMKGVESDRQVSTIKGSQGKPIIRITWPDIRLLM